MKSMQRLAFLAFVQATLVGGAFAQFNEFQVTLAPTNESLSNTQIYLAASDENGNSLDQVFVTLDDFTEAGTTEVIDFATNVPLTQISYGTLSAYGDEGLVLGVDAMIASHLIGKTWDEIFVNPMFGKSIVRDAVVNNGFGTLFLFADYAATLTLDVNGTTMDLFAEAGQESTLISFSQGRANGTANFTPVPEPATLAVLGLGALAMLRRRR